MNIPELLALADYLEALPAKAFDLGNWGDKNECGTVACVAGHYMAWRDPAMFTRFLKYEGDDWQAPSVFGCERLGLTDLQSKYLFVPGETGFRYADVTNLDAAAVIRDFVATGKINWATIMRQRHPPA